MKPKPKRKKMPTALIGHLVSVRNELESARIRNRHVLLAKLEYVLKWSGSEWYQRAVENGTLRKRP